MPSRHQSKRPYNGSQPSITSYFPSTSTSSTSQPSYTISPQSHTSQTPSLPSAVQSNLLSVGMRVRKSVPEGYKTGSCSAFTLFSDSSPIAESPSTIRATTRSQARELTPFCGILKIGGLAQQIHDEEEVGDEENDMPILSQGSTVSNASTASLGANKRRFDQDDEEEEEDVRILGQAGRVIAVPRGARKGMKKVIGVLGQENLGDDFEDAEFLDYGLLGGDEEMGGV